MEYKQEPQEGDTLGTHLELIPSGHENKEVIEARIRENAKKVHTALARMGEGTIDLSNNLFRGRVLDPMYYEQWRVDRYDPETLIKVPENIMSVLSRLAEGVDVSWDEIAPLQTTGHEYFAGLFIATNSPNYLSSGASSIHPLAQQLDRDLREKFPNLMELDLSLQRRLNIVQ